MARPYSMSAFPIPPIAARKPVPHRRQFALAFVAERMIEICLTGDAVSARRSAHYCVDHDDDVSGLV